MTRHATTPPTGQPLVLVVCRDDDLREALLAVLDDAGCAVSPLAETPTVDTLDRPGGPASEGVYTAAIFDIGLGRPDDLAMVIPLLRLPALRGAAVALMTSAPLDRQPTWPADTGAGRIVALPMPFDLGNLEALVLGAPAVTTPVRAA
jgi:hypothetical protein